MFEMLPRPTRFRPTTYPERTHVEHAYRKFRKYGGSAIIATQSVLDLYGNSVGKAISPNSANMFLLGQKPTTLEQVRKDNQLVMEAWAFNMLKAAHTEAGVFSEIIVSVGQLQCVGRLIVSDFQKLLYSTAPNDVNDIMQYQSQGMGIQDAINAVSPALLRKKGRPSEEGRP